MSGVPPALRLFFDTDALLAGAASTRGAAHLLLRLGELGLVDAVTGVYVRAEALRNVTAKLPHAGQLMEALLEQTVAVVVDAPAAPPAEDDAGVHPKDLPVWRAFRLSRAAYLVTFNVRDYPRTPQVQPPGAVLAEIRSVLAGMTRVTDQ